jgi:hypothetical protein
MKDEDGYALVNYALVNLIFKPEGMLPTSCVCSVSECIEKLNAAYSTGIKFTFTVTEL